MSLSLYLHIPFCRHRCPYCDFAISTETPSQRYVDALLREIRSQEKETVSTLHLGGGTPSRMPLTLLEGILGAVRERFVLRKGSEVAIECNPSDAEAFSAYPALGFNRLSLGVQSLDDAELRYLGRDHDAAQAVRAVESARSAGFRNLSLDLIYGLPGQTLAGWKKTLRKALALEPEHLSVYALTLTGAKKLSGPPLPAEKTASRMALEASERLEGAGLRQYEISNFARKGYESRHNLAYWTFQPYLGLGVGAHSYLPPRRFANVAQTPEYVARMLAGKSPQGFAETLTEEQRTLERLFLGLRLSAGLADAHLPEEAGEVMESLIGEGLAVRRRGQYALTPRGRVVADAVTARLVRTLPESKTLQRVGA